MISANYRTVARCLARPLLALVRAGPVRSERGIRFLGAKHAIRLFTLEKRKRLLVLGRLSHTVQIALAIKVSLRCPRRTVAPQFGVRSTGGGDRTDEEGIHRGTNH